MRTHRAPIRSATRLLPSLALFTACRFGPAPVLDEPAAGQTLDHTLVRVRTATAHDDSHPDDSYIAWRVNGGATTRVTNGANLENEGDRFVFSVPLPVGADHLEAGRCDAMGACRFAAVDVTVKLGPGSPDPALAGSGVSIFWTAAHTGLVRSTRVVPLADGRALVESLDTGAFIPIRPDGTPEPAWGVPSLTSGLFASLADGGALAFGGGGRSAAGGLVTLSAQGVAGALVPTMPPVDGASYVATALAADASGGAWLAGTTGAKLFVLHVGADGARQAVGLADAPQAQLFSTAVDGGGNAAFLFNDRIVRLDANGLVGGFGAGGTLMLDGWNNGLVTFTGGGAVAAAMVSESGSQATTRLVLASGAAPTTIALPFHEASSPVFAMATAADGALYVAGQVPHEPDPMSYFPTANPGSDVGLVRVRGGAIDGSFGVAGVARVSLMLSWSPIATEVEEDVPLALWLGAGGAPFVVLAGATDIPANGTDQSTVWRGPGLALARFLP